MRHIERMLRPDAADRGGSIDEALAGFLARTPWRGTYDLIAGVAGHGVYALERLDGESARHCAESVVERIAELAEPVEDGSAWHTPARLLPPHQAAVCPNGYYNLGLAHGVPSVIAVLALLHRAGVMPAMSRSLAAAGMRWLVSLPWANEHAPGFPAWLASLEDRPAQPARIAWCYGDLGVAAAMSVAARAFDDDGYRQLAVGIARRAATRGAEESGVVDAGLCHGAAGVAHAFNRLYQATGDDSLRAAAHEWCCRALEMRGAADGVAGYRAFVGGDDQWESAPGLLTGATGIALALLAAATDVEPSWDRALLLS